MGILSVRSIEISASDDRDLAAGVMLDSKRVHKAVR